MDSGLRAVESYRRSRMINAATSSDDKITPMYKLEEVAELLKSSDVSIVREVSGSIIKRLDHSDPVVKQKVLRLIKYAAGKSGSEFQREMQRHSAALRQLLHYKGSPDPVKGNAPNKAVRDSAQEAMAAIFSEHDAVLTAVSENSNNLNGRIEGFGNTNFRATPAEDKKSFLREIVGFGLSSLTRGRSFIQNGNGNPNGSRNLWRSLTMEHDVPDKYVEVESPKESKGGFCFPRNGDSDSVSTERTIWAEPDSVFPESKTREEKLVETIVTSGGVRLQPTRDAVRVFLTEAAKLDGLGLSRVLESKLRSPRWQVRMRAVCVLDSIIRKKCVEEEKEAFSIVASYFADNRDALASCIHFPQASLQEKAKRVIGLLDGESTRPVKVSKDSVEIPNLIDTGGDADDFTEREIYQNGVDNSTAKRSDLFDDLFGDGVSLLTENSLEVADPFDNVSFHTKEPESNVSRSGFEVPNGYLSSLLSSQGNANGVMQNTMMFDAGFISPSVNYGNFCNEQQLLAAMAPIRHPGDVEAQSLDVFGFNTKKEESRAFDFIADRLAAARDNPKNFI